MKQILDLRPVYHRLEERIRAHVLLCWLALLLIRIAETTTGQTWPTVRRHLDRLHAGTFTGPTGMFRQRTELSKPQRDLLAKPRHPRPEEDHRTRPQAADQRQHHPLETRLRRVSRRVPAGQTQDHGL